jgi:hypothetical protein
MKIARFGWFLIIVLLPGVAAGRQANPSGGDLHAEIQTVYDFQPHTLTKAQIAQK